MSKILYGLMLLLLIPLSSYSQELTQSQDTVILNRYQVESILKDHSKLVFLEKTTKQDSLVIKELNYQVVNYKRVNTNNELRITNFEQLLKVERRKSKFYKTIAIVAVVVLPPATLYIRSKLK